MDPKDLTREQWEEIARRATQRAAALGKIAHESTHEVWCMLAEITRMGSLMEFGGKTASGTFRYTLVCATNDAADHLSAWVAEQARGRMEAAKKAGMLITGQGPGIDPAKPGEPT